MIRTVFALTAVLCGIAHGSVEHGAGLVPVFSAPAPVPLPPPVVTSASSQYFERTFNRLVLPQTVPVAPPPPVFNVAPPPPVFVQPTVNLPVNPVDNNPIQPNIAIAIATAQAAPVATIILPPYPFGSPPIGFIPPAPAVNVPDDSRKESTTPTTTQAEIERTATTKQIETTTPLPLASNSDNNFVQAMPSNDNLNFDSYGVPQPQWQQYTPPQQGPLQRRPQQWPQQQRPQIGPQQQSPPEQPQQQRPQEFPQRQRPQEFPQQQRPPKWPQQQSPPEWPKQQRPQEFPQQYTSLQQGPQQQRPQQWPQQQRLQAGPHQQRPQKFPQQQRPQEVPQQRRPQEWPQQESPPEWPQQQRPQPQWPQKRPQKLRTSVEVVPVPLVYITPPPLPKYRAIKTVNHIHTFVPTKAKLIIRPVRVVSSPIQKVRIPTRLVYRAPINARGGPERPDARDIEPTTFRPSIRSLTKPPRM